MYFFQNVINTLIYHNYWRIVKFLRKILPDFSETSKVLVQTASPAPGTPRIAESVSESQGVGGFWVEPKSDSGQHQQLESAFYPTPETQLNHFYIALLSYEILL